jgi:tetratricopeptide (TPR) repeat protein
MFHFNHTLHVSLMHRRDLGLKVGGYDEAVTVLIDWDMTRKLAFYADFMYVQQITGEYYMPLFKSDRISNLERKDPERYRHNLRKIRADLPPEPWPKVDRITVIHVVNRLTETVATFFTQMVDAFCHPVRYLLVNNEPARSEEECRRILGKAGELKNVSIATPTRKLDLLQAYRFGAEKARGEYVFLASGRLDTSLQYRLTSGRYYLKEKGLEGVKWDVPQERDDPYNILMKRTIFLKKTDPLNGNLECDVRVVSREPPVSFLCDYRIHMAQKHFSEGNFEQAYHFVCEAEAVGKGGTGRQYLADLYSKICFALGKYDEAEEKCANLVRRGYGADNWVRLGRIHQAQGRYAEALQDYQKGLEAIGLHEDDLLSPVFPLPVTFDFDSYTVFIGTAECHYETGNLVEASKFFRRASKLKGFCHRPFLGFGKIFLKTGQLGRAEEALLAALYKNGEDADVHRVLAEVFEQKREWEKAFQHCRRAMGLDRAGRTADADMLYHAGSNLGRWKETAEGLEQFMDRHPGCLAAVERLSSAYVNLGDYGMAVKWLEKGLAIEADHSGLQALLAGIQSGATAPVNGGHP